MEERCHITINTLTGKTYKFEEYLREEKCVIVNTGTSERLELGHGLRLRIIDLKFLMMRQALQKGRELPPWQQSIVNGNRILCTHENVLRVAGSCGSTRNMYFTLVRQQCESAEVVIKHLEQYEEECPFDEHVRSEMITHAINSLIAFAANDADARLRVLAWLKSIASHRKAGKAGKEPPLNERAEREQCPFGRAAIDFFEEVASNDSQGQVRKAAVYALTSVDKKGERIRAIIAAASDSLREVRKAAIQCLTSAIRSGMMCGLPLQDAFDSIAAATTDVDSVVRWLAVHGLGDAVRFGDIGEQRVGSVLDAFLAASSDSAVEVRQVAVLCLGNVFFSGMDLDNERVRAIVDAFGVAACDEDHSVCLQAFESLGHAVVASMTESNNEFQVEQFAHWPMEDKRVRKALRIFLVVTADMAAKTVDEAFHDGHVRDEAVQVALESVVTLTAKSNVTVRNSASRCLGDVVRSLLLSPDTYAT